MSTTIKTGWLNNKNGDKFAPKTLSSQVITADGIILEDKIQSDIDEQLTTKADKEHTHDSYETKEDAIIKYDTLVEAKPDWNQNDETAIDYIKNRPFYDEYLGVAVTAPVTLVADSDTNNTKYICKNMQNIVTLPNTFHEKYQDCKLLLGDRVFENIQYEEYYNQYIGYDENNLRLFINYASRGNYDSWYLWLDDCPEDENSTINTTFSVVAPMPLKQIDPKYLPEGGFGYDELGEIVISNTEVNCQDESNGSYWGDLTVPDLIRGDTYAVIWDGIEYLCIAEDDLYGGEKLGNFAVVGEGNDTGEPFFIYEEENGAYSAVASSISGTHTVKILKAVTHKIDSKYLPEHIHLWNDIEDKPFGEDVIEEVFFEESTLECSTQDGSNYYGYKELSTTINFEEGQTYTVVFDGVRYENLECCSLMVNGIGMDAEGIGSFDWEESPSFPSYLDNTFKNFPFYIFITHEQGYNGFHMYVQDSGTHTFTIYKTNRNLKTIETKFLPEHLQFGKMITNTAVLYNDNLTFSQYEGSGVSIDNQNFDLVLGETYQIVIDGVEYEPTVCKEYQSMYETYKVLGNPSLHNAGSENSGEEYLWIDNFHFFMTGKTGKTVSVKILGKGEGIVPIDEEFLPETIARTEYVNANFALKSDLQNIDLSEYETKTDAQTKLDEAIAYTDTEIAKKADINHDHNDKYYTETEVDTLIDGVHASIDSITNGSTPVKEAEHAESADTAGSANTANTANSATKATQDGNGKVIANTYETKADASAKLTESKEYTDTMVNGVMTGFSGVIDAMYGDDWSFESEEDIPTIRTIANDEATTALDSAKTYADSAASTVKNDLLNGAGAAYDTLKELGDLIDDNKDAIDALNDVAAGKANAVHSHAISDVSGLQTALDGKAAASHGTHVSFDSTNKPKMDGTAAFGTSTKVARADHVHPTDDSRASQLDLDEHAGDTVAHVTNDERTKWNSAKTHADSAHAPSDAEKNQNAFSSIKIGDTTIAANSTEDSFELVEGNYVTLSTRNGSQIEIDVPHAGTNTVGVVQLSSSTSSTASTTAATSSAVKSAYDRASSAKTDAATAQAKADEAYELANSKVGSLSDLGITATTDELNYVDGVTSNIQTQLDGKSPTSHSHTITASASDDDVVVLTGTNGTNKVTYSASHANSGVTAGTYKSVTVNAKGHVTTGTNPTTLSGYGITDAYTKTQVDTIASGKADTSHGTHVSYGTSASAVGSTASAGTASTVSRSDHVHSLPAATSSTLGGVKVGSNISVSNGTISVPTASGTQAGVTVVYPAANCTTFSSDTGTVTPLAVQKGAKQFAITRPSSSTNKAIVRYSNTTGDVQDSKIIIEDVTNTRDTSKKANVLAIPAEGSKKMVYGYCTDQIDGTSFIGGVFDADATEYPYSAGLAIGGTSGNLLWKGDRVATASDLSGKANTSHNHTIENVDGLQDALDEKVNIEDMNYRIVCNGEEITLVVGEDIEAGQILAFKYKLGDGYSISYSGSGIGTKKVEATMSSGYGDDTLTIEAGMNYTLTGCYFIVSKPLYGTSIYATKSDMSTKADASHGNHVPTTQTASNKVFLRNDNTWATVTPANIGAVDLTSNQSVGGVKTFGDGIKIGSVTITYSGSALKFSFS